MSFPTDLRLELRGLVDRSRPLPLPHPQRLSFPNDSEAIDEVALKTALVVLLSREKLDAAALRHLLFKMAAWCSRFGAVRAGHIGVEIEQVAYPVSMALQVAPKWVASTAGVGWTIRRYRQYRCEVVAAARKSYVEPPRVMEVGGRGYYLVELTNAAHVHREGVVMGHCMAWSMNLQALKNRGDEENLHALRYAVKVRSGELRIFSVRDVAGEPVLTIAYGCKERCIEEIGGRSDRAEYKAYRRDAIAAVSKVVPVVLVVGEERDAEERGLQRRRPVVRASRFLRSFLRYGQQYFARWGLRGQA